jgi:crotonobetainyl-CoA:carnitine CoA-transferase CaiB-like acyl-CoA transferase
MIGAAGGGHEMNKGPMSGVRVVELGVWVAGPAAGGILADWGAEVVKVEPLTGDPFRGFYQSLTGGAENPPFELDNRGKKSISLNLDHPKGREIVFKLIEDADVFITNLRVVALERWGLDYTRVSECHPRLIYAQVTGYGEIGPDQNRASYDIGAFWSRTGVASLLSKPTDPPTSQRGGMGDHTTAMTTAAGISAALFDRERSGEGQRVSTSLLRTGLYFIGWDVSEALRWGASPIRAAVDRRSFGNPLMLSYQDSAGDWMWLLGLEPDRHWTKLAAAVGRDDWAVDEELLTIAGRAKRSAEIIDFLDTTFATRSRAEWATIFEEHDVWWSPVLTPYEASVDPAIGATGAFVEGIGSDGKSVRVLANPVAFSQSDPMVPTRTAEMGEDTEITLLNAGYSWADIEGFKDAGAIL